MATNIILLTTDDLNYNSVGFMGCSTPDITPNIDRLATEGLSFDNAHVAIAVCQPSRTALMTGMYPHHNGARGFEDVNRSVTTLTEVLRRFGYYNGIIGKEDHLTPKDKFSWDEYISTYNNEDDYGRNPAKYYQYTRDFLRNAKLSGKPFFLMANTHDPHRPFANSDDEIDFFGRHIAVDYEYTSDEVEVPGFLADIPSVRKEIAQYYSSVRRCDQSVGEILRALREEGMDSDTLIWFLSDNGMAFPFAKTNCYLNSTRSPWIVRWPGKIQEGKKTGALVSGIDFMPTIIEILGLPLVDGLDGKSLASVLSGESDQHYETIYTQFFKTAKNQITKRERHYPMRCVQNNRYAYIYNAWADEETEFMNESMSGITFKALKEAACHDSNIAERVHFYEYRVREELYDYKEDPDALYNLFDNPDYNGLLEEFRRKMYDYLITTKDELLVSFENDIIRYLIYE